MDFYQIPKSILRITLDTTRCGGIAHFGHCGTWLENRNPWRGHLSSGRYGNPGSSIWESRDFD
jgi:hypothetical protein